MVVPVKRMTILPLLLAAATALAGSDTLNFMSGNLLGRPTDHSVTVNVVPKVGLECYFEYGTSPGSYSVQTPLDTTVAAVPHEVIFSGLSAATRYYYRARYRQVGVGSYLASDQGTFRTRVGWGEKFTFAVEGDPHMLPGESDSSRLFELTLANELADSSDFLVDMGDNFMLDKYTVITPDTIWKRMVEYRRWWDQACHSMPLFLVLGNHEGEQGWDFDTTPGCNPVLFTNARKLYYPNPLPDGFYSGDTIPQPLVGIREAYYSWEWGNALFVVLDPYWFTMIKPNNSGDNWDWTLGRAQFDWLKETIETSRAKFKFVFIHHLVGGKIDASARGGSEYAHFFEWGGYNRDSTWGFNSRRAGWGVPIHQMLVDNGVDIVFHGHDHFYAKQDTDGVYYQMASQPGHRVADSVPNQAAAYGYVSGIFIPSSGHIRVAVDDTSATIAYIRSWLPADTLGIHRNRETANSYIIVKGRRDVGMVAIAAPAGSVQPGPVTPQATVRNFGTRRAATRVFFRINSTPVYSESIDLAAGVPYADTTLAFPPWPASVGYFTARCSVACSGDEVSGNDVAARPFLVTTGQNGWTERTPMPLVPSTRNVKDGGWLAYDASSGLVYASKGYKSGDFYSYDPQRDSWAALEQLPADVEGKLPYKGSVGCTDGSGTVYATKGNNTQAFYRYAAAADSWRRLADVPLGTTNKKVKGGTDAVFHDGSVYLLKGYKNEFWRYAVATDSWHALPDAPTGTNMKYGPGSFLVYDHEHTVYCHKSKYHELWSYDLARDTWNPAPLTPMPLLSYTGKTRKSKDGGSAAWLGDGFYAFKGANTQEFWQYFPSGDSWVEQETIPAVGSTAKKKVKAGADLVTVGDVTILALKGNKTNELWQYVPGALDDLHWTSGARGGVTAGVMRDASDAMRMLPNPLRPGFATVMLATRSELPDNSVVSLRIYDAAGRQVRNQALSVGRGASSVVLDLRSMDPGVYMVKLQSGDFATTQKLAVQR